MMSWFVFARFVSRGAMALAVVSMVSTLTIFSWQDDETPREDQGLQVSLSGEQALVLGRALELVSPGDSQQKYRLIHKTLLSEMVANAYVGLAHSGVNADPAQAANVKNAKEYFDKEARELLNGSPYLANNTNQWEDTSRESLVKFLLSIEREFKRQGIVHESFLADLSGAGVQSLSSVDLKLIDQKATVRLQFGEEVHSYQWIKTKERWQLASFQ